MSTEQSIIDTLQEQIRREQQETLAAQAISAARTAININRLQHVRLFIQPVMRLRPKLNWDIDTCATDGFHLYYNPDFVVKLKKSQMIAVLVHEAMHCMLLHFTRLNGRRMNIANIAMDAVINPMLDQFDLPPFCVMPGKPPVQDVIPNTMIWEEIYDLLCKQKPDGSDFGDGEVGGNFGGVLPAPAGTAQQSQAEWDAIAKSTAQAAKGMGNLPGGLKSFFDAVENPQVPWQSVLEQFVDSSAFGEDDYSWQNPDRRFIDREIYFPGMWSERIGELVIAIDTSGSVQSILPKFGAELYGMLNCKPVKVHVVYCDCSINHTEEWHPGDGPLQLRNIGGGGTSHEPLWKWMQDNDVDPLAVICLTDGYTTWGRGPHNGCPVLWAITHDGTTKAPFGTVLQIPA